MRPHSTRAGRFVSQGHYAAFIPEPLPPRDPPIRLDPDLVGLLADAGTSLGILEGVGRVMPNPDFFILMYTRKEALLSSQIEGTQATFVDLLASQRQRRAVIPFELREVINYIEALNYGIRRASEMPFSLRLVREIHSILLEDVGGGRRDPGEFRSGQNYIASPEHGNDITRAVFVPPPVPEMLKALSDLEIYYHEGWEHPLIKCALLHAQFETIHPFWDGNGRVGRLLITLFLRERGILTKPLLYMSFYFKKHRRTYYEALTLIRAEGDWEGWLRFFLAGIAEVSNQAVNTVDRLIELERRDRERMQALSNSTNMVAFHQFMLENPVFTARDVASGLKVTSVTANNLINALAKQGIIVDITGKKRGRQWAYKELITILEEGTREPPAE